MIVALLLGLTLVAVPLYLWRRPRVAHADNEANALAASAASGALPGSGAPPGPAIVEGPAAAAVLVSEARILECHDPGSKKTAPELCDHLAPIEQAFAKAITDSAACVPPAAGGGSLVYLADVSFARKRSPITVTLPRDGRALGGSTGGRPGREAREHASSAKVATTCAAEVKRVLTASAGAALSTLPHAHARYKIAITASYPPPPSLTPL